ncbi:MAG: YicC/YloC family endoribonuclease [Flavobacteriaceae bacterium]
MSMTGFGKKETQYEDKHISIEVRSLNSKNVDINLRSPSYLNELGPEIRKELTLKMYRGKIDVNIYVEFNQETAPSKINIAAVKAYMKQLEGLGASSESERMAIALRLPEILSSEKDVLGENEKKVLYEILNEVIKDLEGYRKNEGAQLGKDISLRIDLIESHLQSAVKIDPERNTKIEEKLRSALENLKQEVDTNRFEQELIFYLEKFDITEEKVRLKNHLNYFREVMENDFPNGKKLGFISQEIGREINTIGSKANHTELQKIVVQMKDELEKIKEQLLNVI